MATRRKQTTQFDPPTQNNGYPKRTSSLDSPPPLGSPFLPTSLESLLLSIYPTTLLLGSLFATLAPATRIAPYNPTTQSYDAAHAPNYFARKSNVFNVYFVKIGWFWISLAFFALIFTHRSFGALGVTRRRAQAVARYACVTLVWVFITQWCFGAPLIDRGFRWTGGQCEVFYGNDMSDMEKAQEREDMGDFREAFTHAACKAMGGEWKGGHDISGHVFLLILGSAMLWLEVLPALLKGEGMREARRIVTEGGLVRNAAVEKDGQEQEQNRGETLGLGVRVALGVVGLSWWMLLMTAAYFHTWVEKFTGLSVAFAAVWSVYFLPRMVPALRAWVGMPGV